MPVLRFCPALPSSSSSIPTYILANVWSCVTQTNQHLSLNLMLTNWRYGPPGEFPKFPHQAYTQAQISHVLVGAMSLTGILYLLCSCLCVRWYVSGPLYTLFLVVPVGATTWTSLTCSLFTSYLCQRVPWSYHLSLSLSLSLKQASVDCSSARMGPYILHRLCPQI